METGKPHHWEVNGPDGSVIDAYDFPFTDVDGSTIILEMDIDITDRKKAEAALRELNETLERRVAERTAELTESEKKLRLFIEHAPAALAMFDRDMHYVSVSRRWLADYGLGGRDVLGLSHYEVFPEITAHWKEVHRRGLAGEVVRADEDRFVRADGSVQWLRWEVRPWHTGSGELGGIVIFSEDITERKHAETALRESKERFRLLFRDDLTGDFIATPEGRILLCNPAFAHIYGFASAEEAVGSSLIDLKIRAENWMTLMERLKKDRIVERFESDHQRRDGGLIHIIENVVGIFDDKGELTQVQGYVFDDTKRNRYEQELRQSEERLARSQEIAHLGSWELDLINDKLTWSDEVYRIFGLKPQEFKATYEAFLERVHPDDRAAVDAAYSGSVRGGKDSYEIEHRVTQKGTGETRWVHEKCQHVRDNSGRIIRSLGMVHDITERKQADDQLKKATDELKRSNAELEQFAYAASHDLREPLRTISAFLRLFEKRYKGKIDEKADEYIGFTIDSVTRMDTLLNDLLEFSRLGSKAVRMNPVNCAVSLEKAIYNLGSAIEESGTEITYDQLPTVPANESQITRLFQNLIANAIKFSGDRKPVIHISAKQKDHEWLFSVRDNGIGIDPEFSERIFVVFQRLHTRQEYEGTGMGLAICKKIVELHGGRIWVESQPGKGSTFYFTIPDRK